jgi:sialic acid synthase SpsE
LYASYAALSLGAKIIEKHYVDTHARKGPDVSCSMDKHQLKELINASKFIPLSIPGKKEPITEENVTMNFAFASVVSKIFIKKGKILNKKNICLKRPGNGDFLAKDFINIIGKKAIVDIQKNTQIQKKYIK